VLLLISFNGNVISLLGNPEGIAGAPKPPPHGLVGTFVVAGFNGKLGVNLGAGATKISTCNLQ
jgi:hypothetical protein